MIVAKLMFATIAFAATAGVGYPAWTRMRAEKREADARWDRDGIREGMQPFEVGVGGPVVILVHGFASGPSLFRFMAPALAEAGYTCRVPRLPGFGERLERMRAVTERDWRAALAKEVEQARSEGRDVWLAGHSMGGTLALDYAQTNPDAVRGVILLAPLIEVSSRRSLGLPPDRLYRAAARLLPQRTILETAFPVDLHAAAEGVEELRDRFLPMSVYDAMFRLAHDVKSRPASLQVPVLVMVPGRDLVVSRAATLAYYETLRADRKQLIVSEKAGHVVPLDYGWEDAVAAMDAFVGAQETLR